MGRLVLPKFLFITGPEGSGKSTLTRLICESHSEAHHESFANPIREMIYSVFFPDEGPIHYDLDLKAQEVKASPFPFAPPDQSRNPFLRDIISFRDVMISFSEDWMKPAFGDDIFGRLCHARCKEQEEFSESFIIDGPLFDHEIRYIVNQEGPGNCVLLRLNREGCHFKSEGGALKTINLEGVRTLNLSNNAHPEAMLDTLATTFLGRL